MASRKVSVKRVHFLKLQTDFFRKLKFPVNPEKLGIKDKEISTLVYTLQSENAILVQSRVDHLLSNGWIAEGFQPKKYAVNLVPQRLVILNLGKVEDFLFAVFLDQC